ncbi:DEAD/DEAH box helicase [Parablautia muri]|uniref:DEAD/DEAH box helicase n=1 Tax=Parablautia muri TaxID=2320879 RepID=A0A9X5BDL7_9FIRM|nr:DEAD/DEAH box helicase [Parablautia muri]NBJ91790.1 DEAD/DEAH box helicase [Parablautia muri]
MIRELYGWQEECLTRWFANSGRGMVQAATGSGKTLVAFTAAQRLEKRLSQNLHVKIVVPTSALMRQWHRDLTEFLSDSPKGNAPASNLHKEIGLRGGGFKASPDCKYMIYVINSARYELARQILTELKRGEAILLIADECHRYASGQNQLIFEFSPYIAPYKDRFFSLGLSATLPSGASRRYLASVLGQKIYNYGITEASKQHNICPFDIYHVSLSFQAPEKEMYEDLSDRMISLYRKLLYAYPSLSALGQKERYELLRSIAGEKNRKIAETASLYMNLSYKRKSLVALASARTACTADLVKRLGQQEKILIFSERTCQANELYQLLQTYYPEKVGRYHSKMGDQANKNALDRFRTGDIRILIACKAIDEGIDVPDASVGIIMSGTSTHRQRIQRLGRIIRKNDAKNKALLYYLHIRETSEDPCFLPNTGGRCLFELAYDSDSGTFTNPIFDNKASLLLKEMQRVNISPKILSEITRCLQIGCIKSDWLLEPDMLKEQIQKARYTSDRNYWICMKKLQDFENS